LTVEGWIGAGLILVAIFLVVTRADDASRQAEAVTPAH
jgi:hypothetical protein